MSLLDVEGLRVEVFASDVGWAEAVSGVDLRVRRGEALGVVGESGCGKSITALAILGLLGGRTIRRSGGRIVFDGNRLDDAASFQRVRGRGIGFVPQDPMTGLNPVLTVGAQIAEAVRHHDGVGRAEARVRSVALMRSVGIPSPESRFDAWPHQFSGGQRQRALIAIALAGDPDLLIADEPTTALDVTIQAGVLQLLTRLRRDRAMGLLLITHDLGVVAQTCDRVTILYAGRSVESGPARSVLSDPRHPYTRGLLGSIPGGARSGRLQAIAGMVPGVGHWPSGCVFRDRCPRAEPRCADEVPLPRPVGSDRMVACHFADESPGGAV